MFDVNERENTTSQVTDLSHDPFFHLLITQIFTSQSFQVPRYFLSLLRIRLMNSCTGLINFCKTYTSVTIETGSKAMTTIIMLQYIRVIHTIFNLIT